jgi:hypothetical protein
MRGKKDYLSIEVIGFKIHEQGQLLCNLKVLHCHFKNSHLGVIVGFLKFASMCHTVLLYFLDCKIHQAFRRQIWRKNVLFAFETQIPNTHSKK